MSGKLIAQIYFYLISAAAIALIVVGIHSTATYLLNSTVYDKYPLMYGAEDCENYGTSFYKGPYPMMEPGREEATLSAEEQDRLKKSCEQRVELERKQRQVEDIRNALVFTSVGLILFLIHFPQAKKYSKTV
ncbi:hypothetical protein HYS97_00985 [Candidatus Daviesbacteria bacterium]|nr:hypothetical protein [Candidatus Daviesbacteria bacterium]